MIYQRTHRGKRGFTFDVVEHQRMINPQNNQPIYRIFTALRNNKYAGEMYLDYDPQGVSLYDPRAVRRNDIGISEFGVRKDLRGKGIGSTLLKKAERIAKRNKKDRLILSTLKSNTRAQKLYRKQGFEKIGEFQHLDRLADGSKKKRTLIMMAKKV